MGKKAARSRAPVLTALRKKERKVTILKYYLYAQSIGQILNWGGERGGQEKKRRGKEAAASLVILFLYAKGRRKKISGRKKRGKRKTEWMVGNLLPPLFLYSA